MLEWGDAVLEAAYDPISYIGIEELTLEFAETEEIPPEFQVSFWHLDQRRASWG